MSLATQISASRCQAAAFRPACSRRGAGCRRGAAVRAAAERQQQQPSAALDRRQALLGLAAVLAAAKAQPALAGGKSPGGVAPAQNYLPVGRSLPLAHCCLHFTPWVLLPPC